MHLVYNSFGEKTEEDDPSPDGGKTPGPVKKWGYDGDGDMTSYVNAMGQTYTYKYNNRDERVEEDDPSPDGGKTAGPVWKWSYDAAGELTEEVDPLGRVTQWVHDGDGDVIQTIAPNLATGGPGDAGTTTYDTYDLDGEKTSETTPQPAGSSGSTTTTWQYDDLGDVTQETDPVPAPGQPAPVTHYFYNADQEQIKEIDPLGRVQTTTLDGLGRTTASTSFTGVAESFGYDALSNLVTTTDASGTATNSFDALGRETKTVDQAGGTTSMGYSLLGNMTSLIDPSGNQTIFQFDGLQRETGDENQLGASDAYQYNAAGQVTQQIDKDGRTRTFQYDDLGRQTQEQWTATGAQQGVSVVTTQHGSGNHTNTVQTVTLPANVISGSWQLTVDGQTTSAISWRTTAADVQQALEGLSAVGAGNVLVSGRGIPGVPFTVQFDGALDGKNIPQMTATSSFPAVPVVESVAGHANSENSSANIVFEGQDASYELGKITSSGTVWTQIAYGSSAATIASALSQLFSAPAVTVQVNWQPGGPSSCSVDFGEQIPAGTALTGGTDVKSSYNPGGPPADEYQIMRVESASGGTFTLSFEGATTAPIAYYASGSAVQTALESLSTIGVGNVTVSDPSGGTDALSYGVTFVGALADAPEPLLVGDASGLTSPAVTIATTQTGSSGPDTTQAITVTAISGTFTLSFSGDSTGPISYGASAATVAAALNALPTVIDQQSSGDYGLVTVTGAGTTANPYLVMFMGVWSGTDVPSITADGSNLVVVANTIAITYDLDGEITSIGDNFSHYAYTFDGQGNVASVDNAGTPGVPDVVLASGYDAAGNRSSMAATIGGTKDFLNSYSYDTLSRLVTMQQVGQSGGNAVAAKEIDYGYDAIGDVTGRSAYNFVGVGPRYDIATSTIGYNPLGLLTSISMTSDVGQVSLDHLTYSYDTLARVSAFGSIDGTAAYGYDNTSQLTSASYVAASGHVEPPNFSVTFDPNGTRTSADGVSTTVG